MLLLNNKTNGAESISATITTIHMNIQDNQMSMYYRVYIRIFVYSGNTHTSPIPSHWFYHNLTNVVIRPQRAINQSIGLNA